MHGIERISCREGFAGEVLGLKALHHSGLNAEAVPLDVGPIIKLRLAFLNAPEIKTACNAQCFQLRKILVIQRGQMVGSENFAPLQSAALVAHIATQVAEIRGAVKWDMAAREVVGAVHGHGLNVNAKFLRSPRAK